MEFQRYSLRPTGTRVFVGRHSSRVQWNVCTSRSATQLCLRPWILRSKRIEPWGNFGPLRRCRMLSPRNSGRAVESGRMSKVRPIVFVVDDDVSVRESLDLLIETEGWEVETFACAQDFLARPRSVAPSCLVLDVSLPGVTGLELQKRIASERPDMPIIFITGHGNVPMTVQAMKAGAVEFLTKPFNDESLLDAIR